MFSVLLSQFGRINIMAISIKSFGDSIGIYRCTLRDSMRLTMRRRSSEYLEVKNSFRIKLEHIEC